MKIFTILKKDIRVFTSSFAQNIFMLLIFPLIIGLLYGMMYENILENKLELNTLKVFVLNEDKGIAGQALKNIMDSEALYFVEKIEVTTEEELQANINKNKNAMGIFLPSNLSDNLFIGQKETFNVMDKGNISIEKSIFNSILKEFTNNLNTNFLAGKIISENTINKQDIDGKIAEFMELNAKTSATNFVTADKTEGKTKISSIALFLTSVFVAFAFFINTEFFQERDKNILKRVFASGASYKTVFFGNFLSIFSLTFFISGIYFLISYYFILKISPPVLDFLGAISLMSLMIASFHSFIIGLFSTERTMKVFFGVIFFAFVILGGSFYPADSFSITAKVAAFTPNFNIQKILESLITGTNLASEGIRIITLLIICAVLTITGMIMFEKRVKV